MSKSLLYTAITTDSVVQADGIVPLGSAVRRFGNAIRLDGNTIKLTEAGYYDISVNAVVEPVAATAFTVSVMSDGANTVDTTTVTPSGVGESTPAVIPSAIVRVYCGCCRTISIVLSASATVSRMTVTVEKV